MQNRLDVQHDVCGLLGPDDRPAHEHEDERQQVQDQRHEPEQRDRRQVGGDVGGDAEHQAGRHRGQQHPARRRQGVDGIGSWRGRAWSSASKRPARVRASGVVAPPCSGLRPSVAVLVLLRCGWWCLCLPPFLCCLRPFLKAWPVGARGGGHGGARRRLAGRVAAPAWVCHRPAAAAQRLAPGRAPWSWRRPHRRVTAQLGPGRLQRGTGRRSRPCRRRPESGDRQQIARGPQPGLGIDVEALGGSHLVGSKGLRRKYGSTRNG